jgi:predicted nucleotidyltransferase component of viral defense system
MEARYGIRENVELFHLLFMQQLTQKLDKRLYALKGGCNLRFFLGSIRYSEDIDIDVHTVSVETLQNMVNKILSGTPFQQILKTYGMNIYHLSMPKQTATTQRWKVQLNLSEQTLPINTKIEFSRRGADSAVVTQSISRELITQYKLRPIFMTHYTAQAALEQKIWALILRTETQARDVFDLYQLFQMFNLNCPQVFTEEQLQTAQNNLFSVSFSEFKSQVLSYLSLEDQIQFDDEQCWQEMVLSIADLIKGAS